MYDLNKLYYIKNIFRYNKPISSKFCKTNFSKSVYTACCSIKYFSKFLWNKKRIVASYFFYF